MAHIIKTIKKRSTFTLMREKGLFVKGQSINLQFLQDKELDKTILVGYTATKKIGNAVKRNRAKRIMRELSKKVIGKYGKKNSYYVLIAKNSILDKPFSLLEVELKKLISLQHEAIISERALLSVTKTFFGLCFLISSIF